VASDTSSVSVPEGSAATVTGTWSTPYAADVIALAASTGAVTKNANGTWSWTATPTDQFAATAVTITATDPFGIASSTSFQFASTNAAPGLSVASAAVSGAVLSTVANSGTWSDVAADTVTLSASLGAVTKNGDGTWSWSLTPSSKLTDQPVTITASDEDGGTSTVTFTVTAKVAVTGEQIFYKGSSFAGSGVDAALDPVKVVARPGAAAQTLSFANLINSTRGINGLTIDVAGLVETALTAADFSLRMSPQGAFDEGANPPSSWGAAPAPTAIVVTPGTATTPARVRLEWADNAITNRWLQVAVLANSRTGLDVAEVSYVGHLLGEVNGAVTSGGLFAVTIADITALRPQVGTAAAVGSVFDINKNGLVQISDITSMRSQVGQALRVITIPAAGSGGHGTFSGSGGSAGKTDGKAGGSGDPVRGATGGAIDFSVLASLGGTLVNPASEAGVRADGRLRGAPR